MCTDTDTAAFAGAATETDADTEAEADAVAGTERAYVCTGDRERTDDAGVFVPEADGEG